MRKREGGVARHLIAYATVVALSIGVFAEQEAVVAATPASQAFEGAAVSGDDLQSDPTTPPSGAAEGEPAITPTPSPVVSNSPTTTQSTATAVELASISGMVFDDGTTPAAGVPVTAFRISGLGTEAAFSAVKSVTTQQGGEYALTSLQPGTYALKFGGGGSDYPALWHALSYRDPSSDVFYAARFTLDSGQNMVHDQYNIHPFGRILGTLGQPTNPDLGGVAVTLNRLRDHNYVPIAETHALPGETFEFDRLAAGTYYIGVTKGQLTAYTYTYVTGGHTEEGNYHIPTGSLIAGTILDAAGTPVVGAKVEAVLASGTSALATVTDAEGHYVIDGLNRGRVTTKVTAAGHATVYLGGSETALRATYLSLDHSTKIFDADIRFDGRPTVRGSVADTSGAPVEGVAVRLISQASGNSSETRSTTNGAFQFGEVPAGAYTLQFLPSPSSGLIGTWYGSSLDAGAVYIVVATEDVETGSTVLTTGASISGTITPPTDFDSAFATLYRSRGHGVVEQLDELEIASGDDMRFEFSGLPAGAYTMSIESGGVQRWLGGAATSVNAAVVELAEGEDMDSLSVAFPQFTGSITGTVTRATGVSTDVTMASVYAERLDGSQGVSVHPSAGGQFRIPGLAPGKYRVGIVGLAGHVETWYRASGGSVSAPAAATTLTVGSGSVTANFAALAADQSIWGEVIDDYTHVPGVTVTLLAIHADGSVGWAGETITDNEGLFYFTKRLRTGMRYTLHAAYRENDEFWTSSDELSVGDLDEAGLFEADEHNGITFRMRPTAGLMGYVQDRTTGEPLADILVTAVQQETGATFTTRSSPYGNYWIRPLAPGSYTVKFGEYSGANSGGAYGPEWLGGSVGESGALVTNVTSGGVQLPTGYVEPGALIAGTIRSGGLLFDDEWAAGTRVELFSGADELLASTIVRPGRLGESSPGSFQFRVRAGGYKICAVPPAASGSPSGCWSGTAGDATLDGSPASAATVSVTASEETTGIHIRLTKFGSLTRGTPSIVGAAAVGEVLTAQPGNWSSGAEFSYTWFADGAPVGSGEVLAVIAAHRGKFISVRVTATLAGYSSDSVTSSRTAKVATAGTPVVTGTARLGATLTATPGTWTTSTTFAYQWYADGTAISGAMKSTFVPTTAQDSKRITVRVTGTKSGYATVAKTSAATLKVTRYSNPSIAGGVGVGYTLTAKPNTWSAGTTFTYQWYANGVAITGATKSTLTLGSAQRDKQISVKVTGRQTGFTSVLTSSSSTARVATWSTPTISGVFMVGSKLSAKPNTWTTGTTFSYQWYADGVAISGATASTLTPGSTLRDKQISVRVTGRKSGYATIARSSANSPRIALTAVPTISGTLMVGSTIAAKPNTWTTGTTFTYQWFANGVAISGATGSTFKPGKTYSGKTLTVRVVGSKSGYQAIARSSAVTSGVRSGKAAPATRDNCPSAYPIKGNQTTQHTTDWIFHVPGGQYYAVTDPEECFATETAAIAWGYRKSFS